MNHRAEELALRLRATMQAVGISFRDIRPPDRQRPITDSQHPGGSPWSATDHLAHVVQSEWGFLAIGQRLVAGDHDPVRLSRRGKTPEDRTAFVNSENQAQVQSRRGQSLEDLLQELQDVCEKRIQLIRGVSNDQLARLVPGSQRAELQWAELLASTRHAEAHVTMVQNALAESRA